MKPIVPKEMFRSLAFPVHGYESTASAYGQQREGTTDDAVNVRLMDCIGFRLRGGSRPGITRYVDARVNGVAKIQHLNTITTVSGEAMAQDYNNSDPEAINAPNLAAEAFYEGDPSPINLVSGWTYTGDPNYPLPANPVYILDPSTNPTSGTFVRNPGHIVPVAGSAVRPVLLRVRPKITWANPANMVYPAPLTATQLDAVATHPQTGEVLVGTYAYNPAKNTVLTVGVAKPLRVVFTPTNIAKYLPAKGQAAVTVVAYSAGYYTTVGPATTTLPVQLNMLFQWGDYTFATITSGVVTVAGTNGRIEWTLTTAADFPHTLADLNNGNADGILQIALHPSYSYSVYYDNAANANILGYVFRVVRPAGNYDDNQTTTLAVQSGATSIVSSVNPVNWWRQILSSVSLKKYDGTTVTNDLTVTITGP